MKAFKAFVNPFKAPQRSVKKNFKLIFILIQLPEIHGVERVNNLCETTSTKLNALARISGYMNLPKRKIIMKSFTTSQFGCCPLVSVFHSRTLNNETNSIQERALKINSNDRKSSFEELLRKDNTVSIHHRSLQLLATEIVKIKNNAASEILNEIFQNKTSSYSLRWQVHSIYHGTESLSFLGPKIWELVPED